jgi:hypothetical protein
LRAITCNRPSNSDVSIRVSQKMLGLVCAEMGRSTFSSLATRRNLTDRHHETDTHSSEEDVSAPSDSDTGDTTDTNFTHRNDDTYC